VLEDNPGVSHETISSFLHTNSVKRTNAILRASERPRRQWKVLSSKLSTTEREDALDKARKQQEALKIEINNLVANHRAEMVKKDKELICLQLRHGLETSSKKAVQDSKPTTNHKLEAELATEKVSRIAAEKRLTAELEIEKAARVAAENHLKDAKIKHQLYLEEQERLSEQVLEEEWQMRFEKEKEKAQPTMKKQVENMVATLKSEDPTQTTHRNNLLAQARKYNLGIQAMLDREQDGTLSLTKHDEIPSLDTCISKLTEIWTTKGAILAQVLPHDLMNDHDAALEFEVEVIIAARVCMLTLQLWSCTPDELLGTGWSLSAMDRLKCGLVPYHHDTPLSSMSIAVVDICCMLQQAVDNRKAARVPTVHFAMPEVATAPSIPSVIIHPAPSFDQDIPPTGTHVAYVPNVVTPVQQPFPPQAYQATDGCVPTYNHVNSENAGQFHTPLDVDTMSIVSGPSENYQNVQTFVPNISQHQQSFANFITPIAPQNLARDREICRHFARTGRCKFGDACKNGHDIAGSAPIDKSACRQFAENGSCRFGDTCKFSHDVAMSAPLEKSICRQFAEIGFCRFGDECRFSHDVGMSAMIPKEACKKFAKDGFCRFGDSCRHSHDPSITAAWLTTQAAPQDTLMDDGPPVDHRSTLQCNLARDKGFCHNPQCAYFHAPGTHISMDDTQMDTDDTSTPIHNACRNEANGATCRRAKCHFNHVRAQGVSKPLKGILKNPLPLAQYMTFDGRRPPTGPRDRDGQDNARRSFGSVFKHMGGYEGDGRGGERGRGTGRGRGMSVSPGGERRFGRGVRGGAQQFGGGQPFGGGRGGAGGRGGGGAFGGFGIQYGH
jgi:hypothetical protein